MLADATLQDVLDSKFPGGSGNVRLSAHTAFSSVGGNMISGSMSAANFGSAASRTKALAIACDLVIGSAATVSFIGMWDSAGTVFLGMLPNNDAPTGYRSFQVDLTNDFIIVEGHAWADDQTIVFMGGTPPGGLTEGTVYYVKSGALGDPDKFQVAATIGGAAINLTSQPIGVCAVSSITVVPYAAPGTHRVSTLSIGA